jgi:signal transduction histidine kinase/CheY-like chemotaxis protein/HPt (histidine-containing phosphotransfer) domain-containing protein
MSKLYKYIIYLAAAFSLLLGIIVLFGWYTHNVALIQVNPAFVPMQYNTALGFFICGIGLYAVCFNFTRTGIVCGALVLAIGGITLLEYIFGLNLFLDQLFMEHYVTTKTSHPGRMAPNTALCFSLSGITLLITTLRNISHKPLLVSIFGALVLGLGLLALIGYFIHIEEIYGWGKLTKMAIHTAVGFIVLGIGFSSLSAKVEQTITQVDEDLAKFKIPFKSYLLLLMTGTIILMLITVGISSIIDNFNSKKEFQQEASSLINEIKNLDKLLTQSAMLAVETGELEWKQDYDDNVTRLDEALDKIKTLAPAELIADLEKNTDAANKHLVRMETEAFEKIALGKRDEAHDLMHSDDYLNYKLQYSDGINDFISGIDELILKVEDEFNLTSNKILYIAIAGLILLPAIWIYIILNQIRIARESRKLYGSMETMVEERTAELEKNTEILNQQKMLIEETIENMDQGIIMTDENLKLLAYNSRCTELLDVSKEMMDGFRDYNELLHHFYGVKLNYTPEEVKQTIELALTNERRVYVIDMPGRILEVRHIPKKNGGFVRIFTDVSEREKTKREMSEQKAIIEKTMDNIEQGIIMFDKDMKVLACSKKYSNIMDIPVDVMQELKTYDQFIRYTREVVLKTPDVAEEIVEAAKSDQYSIGYINFPNDKIIEVRHFPIKGGGAVRTFTDVSASEKAKRELEQRMSDLADARKASLNMMKDAEALRFKAEAATDAKANFLAAMSHEIRTPMNGIIGMVDLLRQSKISSEHSQMLQTISDSGQSLLTIINDILDFSKIEAGKLHLENVDYSIMEILESSADTMKVIALNKGLDLITYIDPQIPQFVIGDPVRIRQILINLSGNAIKFTDTGHVTIRADLQEGDNDDEVNINFRVIDQGIGISEEGQQKLFKAFSQAETSTTRKYGGTGLGLSICQRLTEMMHGKIGVESELGKGSEFHFTLSFKKSDKKIHLDKVSDLAGLNIMLVSQNEMERFVCQQYLEYWNASVINNDDISESIDKAKSCIKQDQALDIIVLCSDWSQEQQLAMRENFKKEETLKNIRFVLLMKGRRTKPRLENPETIQFDVGPMKRVTFLAAISIAAGRASPEVFHEEKVENLKAGNVALSVDDAIKQDALILVAEDNPTNRDVISRQLKILGYTCELANDGKEALEAWRSGRYSILLTDCHMPNMDGYDLTGAIREHEKAQSKDRAPIVAITANALQGEAERCLAAGMDDYMSKPIDMRELRDKLNRWMPDFNPESDSDNAENFISDIANEDEQDKNNNSDAIDSSALMEMFGDDPDMFKEILTDFIQPSKDIIEEIKSAHQEHFAEGVKQAAHKLKSSARSVGANDLADLCLMLETAGKEEDWDTIENNASSVDGLMNEVESYINEL